MVYIPYVLVLIFSIIATITDIKSTKISNKITLSLGVLGLITNALIGKDALLNSLIGMFGVFIFFFLLFAIKIRIGFGDVKFYMAIASCLGYEAIFFILITSCLMSILFRFSFGFDKAKNVIQNIKCIWIDLIINKKVTYFHTSNNKFPMAPYILAATIIYFLVGLI